MAKKNISQNLAIFLVAVVLAALAALAFNNAQLHQTPAKVYEIRSNHIKQLPPAYLILNPVNKAYGYTNINKQVALKAAKYPQIMLTGFHHPHSILKEKLTKPQPHTDKNFTNPNVAFTTVGKYKQHDKTITLKPQYTSQTIVGKNNNYADLRNTEMDQQQTIIKVNGNQLSMVTTWGLRTMYQDMYMTIKQIK